MKFGYIKDATDLQFSLPEVNIHCELQPKKESSSIYVGPSVWNEKAYVGEIFPAKTPQRAFLSTYSTVFKTVEVNATRYGVPKQSTIDKWFESVPSDFRFCFKLPQVISHRKDMLDVQAQEKTFEFTEVLKNHIPKCGPVFGVLPKYFHDPHMLEKFLELWNHDIPLTIEFRNADMINDSRIHEILKNFGVGMVTTASCGERDFVHNHVTNSTFFLRYAGNGQPVVDKRRKGLWVSRIKELSEKGVDQIYVLVHQHGVDRLKSAQFALEMREMLYDFNFSVVMNDNSKSQLELF